MSPALAGRLFTAELPVKPVIGLRNRWIQGHGGVIRTSSHSLQPLEVCPGWQTTAEDSEGDNLATRAERVSLATVMQKRTESQLLTLVTPPTLSR